MFFLRPVTPYDFLTVVEVDFSSPEPSPFALGVTVTVEQVSDGERTVRPPTQYERFRGSGQRTAHYDPDRWEFATAIWAQFFAALADVASSYGFDLSESER